jgi:hypothetical protein
MGRRRGSGPPTVGFNFTLPEWSSSCSSVSTALSTMGTTPALTSNDRVRARRMLSVSSSLDSMVRPRASANQAHSGWKPTFFFSPEKAPPPGAPPDGGFGGMGHRSWSA